jgi:hypothetical protein
MTPGSATEKWMPPVGGSVRVAMRSAGSAIALISFLLAWHADAADLALRINRTPRSPAFSRGGPRSTCVGCAQACRRNGGPFEKVCETLCLDTCRNQ